MTLTLYNTLTRKKEPFRPIDPTNVRMYVCGPTVYDFAHIGNARPVIVFDVLFRLLRHLYGADRVTYARNITDVDDKINARAAEEYPSLPLNEAIAKVTEKTTKQFHEDIAALGVLTPTVEPRATEHIAEMRALCEALVANGHAYVAQDHVLFDVSSMPDYGRLANRSLEEMEAGARVEVAPYKKGGMDFVLWKPSKPGEPVWPSPSGIATPGRPGWHIECSAMADRWLWQEPQVKGLLSEAGLKHPHVFDIHGGGIDLVFPHHENEIAQSRCGHGTSAMANFWMHNGFLQVEGEKMSKSLGNFVTMNELLREWPGDTVRLQMLGSHYRQPIDWTRERSVEAESTLTGWLSAIGKAVPYEITAAPTDDVVEALLDDLNTPLAISLLHERAKTAARSQQASQELANNIVFLGIFRDYKKDVVPLWQKFLEPTSLEQSISTDLRIAEMVRRLNSSVEALSAFFDKKDAYLKYMAQNQRAELVSKFDPQQINVAIENRIAARKDKDFARADRIRDELSAMGIQLKDAKDPATGEIVTTWEVKR